MYTFTKRLLNIAIRLHLRGVRRAAEKLDHATEGAYQRVDMQKRVLAVETNRLEDLRCDAVQIEQEADEAWRLVEDEFTQYPIRP